MLRNYMYFDVSYNKLSDPRVTAPPPLAPHMVPGKDQLMPSS